MNAVALLRDVIARGGSASANFYRDDPAFAVLLHHGYLKEAGLVASVVCDDCDEAHAAPVAFEGGCYGYVCPDLGFVPRDRADLQAVQPDLPLLIGRLSDAFDCKKRRAVALHGQTWRIGSVTHVTGEVMLYFQPRLQCEEDSQELAHAMSREVRTQWRLIVTALGTLSVAGAQAVQLDDLAELDTNTGAVRILAKPSELVGMPRKNTGGRPSEHSEPLAAIITDRSKSGVALDGVNAESRVILADFKALHPEKAAPSIETVKRHLRKSRGGS